MARAQRLDDHAGSVIRLHDDGRVPADNPFVGRAGTKPEKFTLGNRNMQGAALHTQSGELWTHEHGPQGGDEVNVMRAGRNYGWPVITYGMNYDGTPMVGITEKEGMEQPLVYWVPSIAVCGLDFLTGERFPKWRNDLLAGALAQQEVRRIRITGGKVVSQEIILKNIGRVRDVATGPDGLIYVILNDPDRIVRLLPADGITR
jgi:glucose/arabinose dehydrogenase